MSQSRSEMSNDPYIYFFLETGKTRAVAVELNPDTGTLCMCFDIRNSIQSKIPPASIPALIRKVVHTQKTQFFDGVGTTQRTSSNLLQRCLYFPLRVWYKATGFDMSKPTLHCIPHSRYNCTAEDKILEAWISTEGRQNDNVGRVHTAGL